MMGSRHRRAAFPGSSNKRIRSRLRAIYPQSLDVCIVGSLDWWNADTNKLLHRVVAFWLEAGLLHGGVPVDRCLFHPPEVLPPDRPYMFDPEFDFTRGALAGATTRQ
jgi:hypothetical protein